jgi:hypothetical protein
MQLTILQGIFENRNSVNKNNTDSHHESKRRSAQHQWMVKGCGKAIEYPNKRVSSKQRGAQT